MSMMLISRPCSYAIRALTYLAAQPLGKLSGTREIADHEGLPQSFLGKVLLALRRHRFLRSQKGIRGGYELAMAPEQISLLAIVRSIDGEPLTECPLEDHQCSVPRQCPLHSSWGVVRDQVLGYLQSTTVADVVRLSQMGSDRGSAAASAVLPAAS